MKKAFAWFILISLLTSCSPDILQPSRLLPAIIEATPTLMPPTATPESSPTSTPIPTPTPTPVRITAQNLSKLVVLNSFGKGEIIKFKYSPDGRLFFILTTRGLFAYNAKTFRELWFHDLGHASVSDFSFNSNGSLLYMGEDNISSWDIANGLTYIKGSDYSGNIKHIVVHPLSNSIVAIDGWKGAELWNFSTMAEPVRMIGHYSDVNDLAFCGGGTLLVTAGDDKTIIGWEMPSGKRGKTYTGFKDRVLRVVCTDDGRYIAGFDAESNIIIFDLQTKTGTPIEVPGDTLTGMTLMNGAKTIAVSSLSGLVRFFNLETGSLIRELASFEAKQQEFFRLSHEYYLGEGWRYDLSFSPDDRYLATGTMDGQAVMIWDLQSSKETATLKGFIGDMGNQVITKDGRYLVITDDNRVIFLDPVSLKVKHELSLDDQISEITISSDSKWLITSETYTSTYHISVWDLDNLKQSRTFEIPYGNKEQMIEAIRLFPDNQFAVMTSNIIFTDTYNHRIVNMETGETVRLLEKYDRGFTITPDLKTMIIGNKREIQIIDMSDWKVKSSIKLGKYFTRDLHLTKDGILIVLKRHYSNRIGILEAYDISSSELVWSYSPEDRSIGSMVISPAENIIAASVEDRIYFIDPLTGNEMRFINDCGDNSCWGLWGMLFSPDQQFFYYTTYVALNQMGIPK